MTIRVDVALVPREAGAWRDAVAVVVDALRASTTIVTALEHGARAVIPIAGVEEARRAAAELGALLAGEIDGIRPPGFELNNSPSELAATSLTGRVVVLRTSNGTNVLAGLRGARRVLIGSLPNATAVCTAAVKLARADGLIGIVCAGRNGRFVLDDALVAGVLVRTLERLAAAIGEPVVLADGALAARALAPDGVDIAAGVRASASGRRVIELGMLDDLDRCLRHDVSHLVPVLVDDASPRLEPLVLDRPAARARARATRGLPGPIAADV
jgi:2-phosphosulfolactate phosphatase